MKKNFGDPIPVERWMNAMSKMIEKMCKKYHFFGKKFFSRRGLRPALPIYGVTECIFFSSPFRHVTNTKLLLKVTKQIEECLEISLSLQKRAKISSFNVLRTQNLPFWIR